eukprot:4067987-Prymnesium_polylepis.1
MGEGESGAGGRARERARGPGRRALTSAKPAIAAGAGVPPASTSRPRAGPGLAGVACRLTVE